MRFFIINFGNSTKTVLRGASLFCLVLLLTNCTKREDAGFVKIVDPQFEGPPPSIPTLTMNSPSYYDQFSRLSIGLASMFGDTAVCNGTDLLDNLTDLVNTQQNKPARMAAWYANLNSNGFQFKLPTTSADHYDCLAHRIQNISTPTTPNPWMTDFYQYFNVVGSASLHYVELGIPDYEDQVPGNLNKPVLVMPDPEIIRTPELSNTLNAYYWNQGAARIDTIVLDDIDDYYDLLELSDYFIVTVSYDIENTQVMTLINDCSEGYTVDDGYCDGNCGETVGNSPNDCAHENNKVLYLGAVRINNDFRNRGGTLLIEKRHWEPLIDGDYYETGFTSLVVHGNGKVTGIENQRINDIATDSIRRSRKKIGGTIVTKGTSYWVDQIYEHDDRFNTLGKTSVNDHFNPQSDAIYFALMEIDVRRKFDINFSTGLFAKNLVIRSLDMSASKYDNTFGYNGHPTRHSKTWFDEFQGPWSTFDTWYDETRTVGGDTQPVKVYKRSFGLTNNVDYEIYYLKNRREW